MVSLEKGKLKVNINSESFVRLIYDLCFVGNIVVIFALYQVKFAATVTALLMFASSILLWVVRKKRSIVIPYNTVWFLAFTAWSAASIGWSTYYHSSQVPLVMRMLVVVAMITSVAIYVDNAENLERLVSLFIIGAVIIVFLELSSVPVSVWFEGGMGEHFSESNQNEVAFWIMCAEIFAFYFAYLRNKRWMYLVAALLFFFVVLTSSRKGLLGGLVAPVVMIGLSTYKKNYFFKLLLIVSLAIGVFLFVMTNEEAYNIVGRRFDSLFRFIKEPNAKADGSAYLRIYFIGFAKQLFAQRPVTGHGVGNFMQILSNETGSLSYYCHNNYWQILSELGIIGFLIYYSLYFGVAISLMIKVKKRGNALSVLFLTMIMLIFAFDAGLISFYSKYVHLIIAMAYAATYVSNDGRKFEYIGKAK